MTSSPQLTAADLPPLTSAGNNAPPISTSGIVSLGTATRKGSGSAQVSAAGKDRATTPEVRGKSTGDEGTGTSSSGSNTGSTPFAAKVAEAQGTPNGQTNHAHDNASTMLQGAMQASQMPVPSGALFPRQAGVQSGAPGAAENQAAAPQADTAAPMPGVTSAQLIQSAGQAEMRVGLHSTEFGNISISTSVTHQVLSAQISIDHAELGRALAMHLPAMEEKLGTAYGLHTRVEVRDESSASRPAPDSGQQQTGQGQANAGGGRQRRADDAISSVNAAATAADPLTNTGASSSLAVTVAAGSRLDIRI